MNKNIITKIRKRYDADGFVFYAEEDEITRCDYCKKIITRGMTDDEGLHVHEECFDKYMDKTYGKGNWIPTSDTPEYGRECDEYGGYYLVKDRKGRWRGTGIFYTEWEDDWDADFNYTCHKRNYDYDDEANKYWFRVFRDSYTWEINYILYCVGVDKNGNNIYKRLYNPTEEITEIKYIERR